jgi:hypothetical protein
MIERNRTLNGKASAATILRPKTPKVRCRLSRELLRSFSNTDLRPGDSNLEASNVPRISAPQPLSPYASRQHDHLQANAGSENVKSSTRTQQDRVFVAVDQEWIALVSGIIGTLVIRITLMLARASPYYNMTARYQGHSRCRNLMKAPKLRTPKR